MQLLVEFNEDLPSPVVLDAMGWMLEQSQVHGSRISGEHPSDPAVHIEWGCSSDAIGYWQSQGIKPRAPDLKRFWRGLNSGDHPNGIFDWMAQVGDDDHFAISTWLDWRDERPWIQVEWLWIENDPGSTLGLVIEQAMLAMASAAPDALPRLRYLSMTDDNQLGGTPALENAQAWLPPGEPPDVRPLRSYAWVTYLDEEQLQAVGGLDGMRASGAFCRVVPVRSGCVLQATEHLADYVGPRVRAVRNALHQLLPPNALTFFNEGFRLAWDDGTDGPFKPPEGTTRFGTPSFYAPTAAYRLADGSEAAEKPQR